MSLLLVSVPNSTAYKGFYIRLNFFLPFLWLQPSVQPRIVTNHVYIYYGKHCCKKSDVENIGSLSGSLLIFFCFHPHDIAREPHVSSMAKVAIHFTWSPKCFSDHIDGFCFVLYTFVVPVYMWVSGNKKLWYCVRLVCVRSRSYYINILLSGRTGC